MSKINNLLAIDIGGTKLAAALMTMDGDIIFRHDNLPTCQTGMRDGFLQIVNVIDTILLRTGIKPEHIHGIGIGIPAVLEKDTDLILWVPNINDWINFPLRSQLQDHFHVPVFIEYDGHTAVLGEWWKGAGKEYQTIAMVIIGTGVGGGLVINGELFRGNDRLAGAVGWFAMTDNHEFSSSSIKRKGHFESLVAGPSITQKARDLLAIYPDSILHKYSAEDINAKVVFDHARQKDELCMHLVQEIAGIIGLGISNIVDIINPELVVLGGSIGQQGDLLIPCINKICNKWAQPSSAKSVVIKSSLLGKDAGIYGAAYTVILRSQGE